MNTQKFVASMVIILAALGFAPSIARADEPAPSADEVEESAEGDVFATATQALGKAERALDAQAGLRKTVAQHTEVIDELRQRVTALERAGAPTADIDAAKRALAEAVKADADRAGASEKAAKESAEKAFAEADRAEKAARAAEESARTAASNATTGGNSGGSNSSLNGPEPVDRDAMEHPLRPYVAGAAGTSWMFRQVSYTDAASHLLENDELSSGMLTGLLEFGATGLDKKGRWNLGGRAIGEYNVGGGYNFVGEGVVGIFVEKTHTFRLEVSGGYEREEIPTDGAENYLEYRGAVGIGGTFLFGGGHVGIQLLAHAYLANDLDDSNAGEGHLLLRAEY